MRVEPARAEVVLQQTAHLAGAQRRRILIVLPRVVHRLRRPALEPLELPVRVLECSAFAQHACSKQSSASAAGTRVCSAAV